MNQSQTIAQLKAVSSPDSLWHFLSQIPFSMEAQIFYGVLLFGIAGMVGSWLVKWSQNAAGGFADYFFRTSLRRTVATLCAYVGAMATGIGTGVFFTDVGGTAVFVGWLNVAWASLTTAFGADMGINKGTRKVLTPEERAEVRYAVKP